MKTLKVIAIESLITIISMVMIIRTLLVESKIENKFFLSVGIGLSIIYMIYRIVTKVKEESEKRRISEIVTARMTKSGDTFLSYIDRILINHKNQFTISNRNKEKYKLEENSKKFFEVDFRIPDPYTGTSMGNLAEQVDFGIKREYSKLEQIVTRYSNKIDTKNLELFESLSENIIFKSLLDCKLWFDQIKMFNDYAAETNPTYSKDGLPITISMDYDQHKKDYNNMIDLLFAIKGSA